MVMEAINVRYQGMHVGAVSFNRDTGVGAFEYDAGFVKQGAELAPLTMPLSRRVYSFPALNFATFKGLPGLIADSLPDDFGNAVLNAWIASRGKQPSDITPLQRLQYTGRRGMGALEYVPAAKLKGLNAMTQIEVAQLVRIAQDILDARNTFSVELPRDARENKQAMLSLLSVGMSAGGARAKAVLAFNEDLSQVRSGQARVPAGFTQYIMKFDGVSEHNKQQETFGDPTGFGAMEYVYYLLAKQCGITMMPCRLLHEGHRRHFITQRFDREGNNKIHVQTLNAMAHVDYKQPGSFSYAELFAVCRQLKLSSADAEQLCRRMVFNIVARNHDDHAKNFAFLLRGNKWSLAPAYDLAYSYKPSSKWVNSHWMTLNGKRDYFTRDDIYSLENVSPLFSRKWLNTLIEEITDTVACWQRLARDEDVPASLIDEVQGNLRLTL